MENKEPSLFMLEQQRLGRKEFVLRMLGQAGIQWRGDGVESYLERELRCIEEEEKESGAKVYILPLPPKERF